MTHIIQLLLQLSYRRLLLQNILIKLLAPFIIKLLLFLIRYLLQFVLVDLFLELPDCLLVGFDYFVVSLAVVGFLFLELDLDVVDDGDGLFELPFEILDLGVFGGEVGF